MKCVKNVGSGEVRRLSEAHALELVEKGVAKFCPKSEWKALRVKPVEVIVYTDEQKREIQNRADKRKHSQSKKNYRKS